MTRTADGKARSRTAAPATAPKSTLHAVPAGVWALGFVSLFMDLSSEMIHALLPVYLVTVLGTSALTVGVIEGIAEATSQITRIFSGALSDWLGRRKILLTFGYGLAACAKPLFPLAPSAGWIVAARFIDRLGKGIRGAPRDALVADLTPPDLRGASFGLRQSLDTVGAFLGPLVAIALMWLTADRFATVFWVAVAPALIAVTVIVFAVDEPPRKEKRPTSSSASFGGVTDFGTALWLVIAVGAIFALARFSEAFLVLRAQSVGLPVVLIPAVLVVMNIAYALSAYPVGALSDRLDRTTMLVAGLAMLVVADLILGGATGMLALALGVGLWGLHMGFTQGLIAALVADTAPADQRGMAFGLFNLVSGLTQFCASMIAGELWDVFGPDATFFAGAVLAVLALLVVLAVRRALPRASDCAGK